MVSYFDQIAKNNLKSLLLMGFFFLLFAAIIWLVVYEMGGGVGAFIVLLVIVLFYAFISYFIGTKMILGMERAQEADRAKYPHLYSIVEGLAQAIQVPMPKIYVMNDPNPNAFATGRDRKHSVVCVTSGLLSMMNDNELTGVLAHEMSHVQDNDIRFMMLAIVFGGVIGILAIFLRNLFWFGGNRRNGGALIIIGIVAGILAPLIALLIRLAISRRREYMADANGARLIRDPAALASALTKIQKYESNPMSNPVKAANEMTASLYFANPLKTSNIANIFSTHPPIAKRIEILKSMY